MRLQETRAVFSGSDSNFCRSSIKIGERAFDDSGLTQLKKKIVNSKDSRCPQKVDISKEIVELMPNNGYAPLRKNRNDTN